MVMYQYLVPREASFNIHEVYETTLFCETWIFLAMFFLVNALSTTQWRLMTKECWINEVLDKPGVGIMRFWINQVLD